METIKELDDEMLERISGGLTDVDISVEVAGGINAEGGSIGGGIGNSSNNGFVVNDEIPGYHGGTIAPNAAENGGGVYNKDSVFSIN